MVPANGVVSPLYIPSWRGVPDLRDLLVELTGLPTVVDNDAKAVALGRGLVRRRRGASTTSSASSWAPVSAAASSAAAGCCRAGSATPVTSATSSSSPTAGRARAAGSAASRPTAAGGRSRRRPDAPPQRAPRAIIERTGMLVGRALASVGAIVDLKLRGHRRLGGARASASRSSTPSSRGRRRARGSAHLQGFTVVPGRRSGQHAPLVGAAALAPSRRRGATAATVPDVSGRSCDGYHAVTSAAMRPDVHR